jgi:general secretion pathway protein D
VNGPNGNGQPGGNPNPANLAGFNPANPANLAGFNGGAGGAPAAQNGGGAVPGGGIPIAPTITFNNATGQLESTPGSSQFSTLLTVLPDVRTNSIVVSGTATDIAMIRSIVDKLDVLLAQVSIQVVIAEVTLTDTDVSGISALNLTVGTDTPAGAGGDNGRGTHITNFTGTVGSWSVTSGVVNPLSFVAAMSNNGSNSKVKVLQANTIITEHGKQGDFQVQQKQPTVTGVTSTPNSAATNGVTTQSNVTYQNVGVEVKVTPLIGSDGGIELNIDQIVDDIIGNVTIDGNPTPIIGHREANVFINVQDGEMIVLGGLQSSKVSVDRNKVGFLYEIPIISNLLGGRNNETDRRELLLFVRPRIISPTIGTADTQKKIDAISEKKDINDFLKDESKLPAPTVIDRFVK